MWSNNKSLKVVVPRKLAFKPPYCPNHKCPWHDPKTKGCFHRHGKISIARFPYVSPRFKCLNCRKTFTSSFFSLNYRDQLPDLYEEILTLRLKGDTKLGISRFLGCSLWSVETRIAKMSRQGLLTLAMDLENMRIKEPVAYDGIENFSFSQYDPNNINHAVGRSSLFVYDFNFCHINRKGRMSQRQKRVKRLLEDDHGRYPSLIERCTRRVVERLLSRAKGPLIFHSDNHFLYRKAIKKARGRENLSHEITLSTNTRNYLNKLFAINHLDMLTRHHLASFKRETIAFTKHSIAMVDDFILLTVHKNYMRPRFVKKQKRDPKSNRESPAMALGLRKRIEGFHEVFQARITKHQVKLNNDWLGFFERKDPYSRRPIRPYTGI